MTRTRFAPSPTGYLHIGGVRTALFAWLYARQQGGQFLLRIDDTDLERSTKEYEDGIKADLDWLGLHWDETFKQSERFERYNAVADDLRAKGLLYPCYETEDELEKPHHIFVAMDEVVGNATTFSGERHRAARFVGDIARFDHPLASVHAHG